MNGPRTRHGVRQGAICTRPKRRRGGDSIGGGAALEESNSYARRYEHAVATGMQEHEHRPGPIRTLAQMTPEERAEMERLYGKKK